VSDPFGVASLKNGERDGVDMTLQLKGPVDCAKQATIALYNREREADGPGGTAHLVATAQRWGFKTIELDATKLLEP